MKTVYCRHVRTNGERCCAFAMRDEGFCFFHSHLNSRHGQIARRTAREQAVLTPLNGSEPQLLTQPEPELTLELPPLEDREAIQLALSMLVTALGAKRIDPRRASAILYGLQVASANAAHLQPANADRLVVDTVTTPDGHTLAPDVDPDHLDEADIRHFRTYLNQTAPPPQPAHLLPTAGI
ncbi:MAG: hypothetical protein PW735_03825 [Acidobacteriaceae bacterium]|nr:hypothetical protein [Acidobacteriaceae bacterium]